MVSNHSKTRLSMHDINLFLPVLFLVGIGIIMVYSASSALALKRYATEYFFVKRQAVFAVSGIGILLICRSLPYRLLRPFVYPLLGLALLFLCGVLISEMGRSAGGATRWLRLGPLTFQPAELARIAMIIYLAYSLSKKEIRVTDFSIGFMPHVIVLGIFTVLILMQPDFGSAAIMTAIVWMIMFVGGVRLQHLLLPLGLLAPALYLMMISADYRVKRLKAFVDPWASPTGDGYQLVHSLMAFGTGGIWGTGLGKGYQKLFYLPEPHTDFIFSVIGEELGLVGVLIILVLYSIILWQGLTIACNTRDRFGAFTAAGLTISLGLQVCINLGVTLGLLPTKGLTLPFLSYGGTSLLLNMAAIGILMNIGASTSR